MTILCYHAVDPGWRSVLSIPPQDFGAQLRWLLAHRRVLDLTEAVQRLDPHGGLPRGGVALTFDDGFRSVYEHAFPLLRTAKQPATVFIVTDTLTPAGRHADWVDDPPNRPLPTLSAEEIREMLEAGLRFGSHSASHRDLTQLSDAECLRDLRDSRETLEEVLGCPVHLLAYPRGWHDERVRRLTQRAGFSHAFSLPERSERAGPLAVPRVGVYRGNGVRALALKTSQWYLRARTGRVYPFVRDAYKRAFGSESRA
jgi:peptidoglycan/xylan/chitin deacetylase (PgdA/CDA1 family)